MAIKYIIIHNVYKNTYQYHLDTWAYAFKDNLSDCFLEIKKLFSFRFSDYFILSIDDNDNSTVNIYEYKDLECMMSLM